MGRLDDISQHISNRYNEELEDLRNEVLAMGGLVEHQLDVALKALVAADAELGQRVASTDYRVNAMEVAIDEHCTRIIALRQPAASDLRLVVAVIKTITDLERIGDEAKRVGLMAAHLSDSHAQRVVGEAGRLASLGNSVKRLLHSALDALARMDHELAFRTVREDRSADLEHETVQRRLVTLMAKDPANLDYLLSVSWAARALERVGDHAKNIAEYVVYLVYGKDIRHVEPEHVADTLRGGV